MDEEIIVKILGVNITNLPLPNIFDHISSAIQLHNRIMLSYVNIHALNLAYSAPWFRDFLNRADIVFCDGYGVMLGARMLGQKLEHRFTPPDWIGRLCELCVHNDYSLYLIGSKPDVAEKAAQKLRAAYPGVNISGTMHGYFDKTAGSTENEAVVAAINRVKPNILIVGFGMPLQEQWIQENFARLEVNVFLPVGAALDYVAGEVRRGPRWMTDHGLEWLARLAIEPRRLWKRYLIGNPLFFWRILKQWWRER